jgi:protein TonB
VKSGTQLVSVILHLVVFGLALRISAQKAKHRATAVAIVGTEKKKPKPKTEEKPKPKPKVVASAKPETPHEVAPLKPSTTPSKVETAPQAVPVETGLQLGNDGPGIDIGGPPVQKKEQPTQKGPTDNQPKQQGPKQKQEKVLGVPKGENPEEDNCTEAPSKPVPIQRTEIEYTQEARANNIEGRLVLRITVGADGSVEKVDVVSSVDPSLDAAAIAVVKGWTFKPAMRCGKPMRGGVYTIAQRFELGD